MKCLVLILRQWKVPGHHEASVSISDKTSYPKVSEPWDLYLELCDRSEIWQAPWQRCCRCACQILRIRDFARSHDKKSYRILKMKGNLQNNASFPVLDSKSDQDWQISALAGPCVQQNFKKFLKKKKTYWALASFAQIHEILMTCWT